MFHDPAQGGALIADLSNGNYPNLFANGHEIGSLIPAAPIIMDGSDLENSELSFSSSSTHCPIFDGNGPGWNDLGWFFDIASTGATQEEQELLADYGKVFFYYVEVYERSSNMLVLNEYLQVNVNRCTSLVLTGNLPELSTLMFRGKVIMEYCIIIKIC